jgi:site-specific DNA-cytosine methylase
VNGHGQERPPRIGSLCTGYGGLDLAVMDVLGGELAWCADNDRHVSAILAARFAIPTSATSPASTGRVSRRWT